MAGQMVPPLNLPAPQTFELASHIIDRLIELVDLVVKLMVAGGARRSLLQRFVHLAAVLQTAKPQGPVLARALAAAFSLRQQPPSQASGSQDGTGHGAQQDTAA